MANRHAVLQRCVPPMTIDPLTVPRRIAVVIDRSKAVCQILCPPPNPTKWYWVSIGCR